MSFLQDYSEWEIEDSGKEVHEVHLPEGPQYELENSKQPDIHQYRRQSPELLLNLQSFFFNI